MTLTTWIPMILLAATSVLALSVMFACLREARKALAAAQTHQKAWHLATRTNSRLLTLLEHTEDEAARALTRAERAERNLEMVIGHYEGWETVPPKPEPSVTLPPDLRISDIAGSDL